MGENEPETVEWSGALQGYRLYLGGIGFGLALFLTGIEATIVSTSLVTIADDFGEFGQSSWVITSYLLTYTGFLIIWSNCSNIWGVKPTLLVALFLFVAFSGGCGAAQSLSQLIICRAFQGIGGAGVYSLTLFAFVRIVSYDKYDKVSSLGGGIVSMGLVLGPLFGGAFASSGGWRWVFLFNVPAGAFAGVLIMLAIPAHFPHAPPETTADDHTTNTSPIKGLWEKAKASVRRVDFLGAFIVLAASSFIIAALQEGNYEYDWDSALVVSFLVISGVFWIFFLWWERFLSRHDLGIDPIFPWRMARNRIFMGAALGFFTTGLPITVCVINIPQRFQIVNGSSAIGAGVKLLSYALSCLVGIMACSVLIGRLRIPFAYIALVSVALQVSGLFLFSEIASVTTLWLGQFGYLVLAGLGTGTAIAAFYLIVPLVVDRGDQPIAMGTALQLRTLGGVLGVAASTSILHHYLRSRLSSVLQPAQLDTLLESSVAIAMFPHDVQIHIREVYATAYSVQMKLAGGFAVAQLLAVAMIWNRPNVRFLKN